MSKKTILANIFICLFLSGKTQVNPVLDSLKAYNQSKTLQFARENNLSADELKPFLQNSKNSFMSERLGSDMSSGLNYNKFASMPAANIDFETGNFNGWNLYTGINNNSVNQTGSFNSGAGSSTILAGGTDSWVPISLMSPLGGNFVARVNRDVTGAQHCKLQNKIYVTPATNLLKFAYACVFQKAGHNCEIQPYMSVTLRDTLGKLLFNYFIVAPDSAITAPCKGYNQDNFLSGGPGGNYVCYSDWRIKCVDLSAYVGRNIFLEIIGASCTATGHFGYGYFDARLESCPDFEKPNFLVVGSNTVSLDPNFVNANMVNCLTSTVPLTMSGPAWPAFYKWNGPSGSYLISGSTQSVISLKEGLHTLSIGNNSFCPITKSLFLKINQPGSVTISGPTALCLNSPAVFNAGGAASYTWSNGQISPFVNITPTTTGVFTLGITAESLITPCIYTNVITYTVYGPFSLSVTGNTNNCYGITSTYTASGGTTYNWFGRNIANPNATASGTGSTFSIAPSSASRFTVSALNSGGCSAQAEFTINVISQPTFVCVVNQPTICAGNTSTLYFFGTGSTNTVISGFTNTVTTSPMIVSPSVATTYTVINSGNVCGTPSTQVSVYITTLTPTISIIAGPTLCSSYYQLSSSGASLYTWATPTGTFTTNQNNYTFYDGVSGIYTLTGMYTASGCPATQTAYVNVTSSPSIVISPPSLCAGVLSTVTLSGGGPVYTVTPYSQFSQIAPTFTTTGTFTTIPPSNQYYYQIFTNLNGCASYQIYFYYPAASLATPTIVATSTSLCAGGSATLTTSSYSPIIWSTGSTTFSTSVTPTITTNYVVSYTNSCGVSTNSITIQYTNALSPTVSIAANNYSPCTNITGTLTASGANSYTWSPGPVSPTRTITNSGPATYAVYGTATNGCIGLNTISIIPFVQVTPTVTGNFTTCPGITANYTVNGLSSFSWNTGSTAYTTNFNPPGALSVSGTDPNGCNSLLATANTYTFYPNIGTLSLSPAGTPTCCPGLVTTLTLSNINFALQSYTWSNGAVNIPTIAVNPTVTTTYSLTGLTSTGCSTIMIKTVSVNPVSAVSFSIPTLSACPNSGLIPILLTPTSAVLNSLSNTNSNFNPGIAGVYTLFASYTNSYGCFSQSPVQTITVLPEPDVYLTIPQNTFCQNGPTIALTPIPSGGVFSGSGVSGSILTPSITGNNSVIYSYTDNNGCTDYDHQCVSVYALPTLTITSNFPTVCAGQLAILIVSGANTYSWDNGSTSFIYGANPTVTTTYTVIGTSLNGCQNTGVFTQSVSPCTILAEVKTQSDFFIFPNPTTGIITIITKEKGQKLLLFNCIGKLVATATIENETTQIDLSSQPPGIYFIKCGDTIKKIVRQN
jgi:hypothetical protein